MPKISIENLASQLQGKRGSTGVRKTAKDIGISPATLSRVENGNMPDLETFSKICKWLQIDPGEILGINTQLPNVTIEFRKDEAIKPTTSQALAELITAAQAALVKSNEI